MNQVGEGELARARATGYRPRALGDRPPGWAAVKMGRYRPRPWLRPSWVGEDRVGRTLKTYWSGLG